MNYTEFVKLKCVIFTCFILTRLKYNLFRKILKAILFNCRKNCDYKIIIANSDN